MLRVAGTEEEARAVLAEVAHVASVQPAGAREPGTVDVVVTAEKGFDIRAGVFTAFARAGRPLLGLKTMDFTLEDIFLNLITEEKEAS